METTKTLLVKKSSYEDSFKKMDIEEVAELITTTFERDCLGEWPRFATDKSIENACYSHVYNENLKWLEENYEELEEFVIDEQDEYKNGEWIYAGQNKELEIDYEKILDAINDGEDLDDIIEEIQSDTGYEEFDSDAIQIIPTTLRNIKSRQIELDSRIGLDDDEHNSLLDEKGNFRYVIDGDAWVECYQSTFHRLEPHWAKCSKKFNKNLLN